ncbi:unnamed protein product [Urochloa humidicola]
MNANVIRYALLSWNVRGLGDSDKYKTVRDTLATSRADIVCLQESKLSHTPDTKARAFLPPNLKDYHCVDAIGSCGGIITAWNNTVLTMSSFIARQRSLTIFFHSTTADSAFAITNVYAPSDHRDSVRFLEDLEEVATHITGNWIIAGDFNLTRGEADNSNGTVHRHLADAFNDTIHSLGLTDIPLLDRLFTWSNQRASPTLARLDRVLLNTSMIMTYPNTTLTSLPKPTSDHTPIFLSISTAIPKPNLFRFENAWLHHQDFLPSVLPAWHTGTQGDAAARLVRSLKAVRCASKVWARGRRAPPALHQNCKFVIYLFDVLEESRLLSVGERALRAECQERLASALRDQATYWKQRGKRRAIREGDANTSFFQAHACQRLRRNHIRAIEVDGVLVTGHDAKTRALTAHLQRLVGTAIAPTIAFDIDALYANLPKVQHGPLTAPFSESEAQAAVRAMKRASSPGPDGFGPGFYKAAWSTVSASIMEFAAAFQEGSADLERLNRSYVVMLPKSATAVQAKDYRPICLQNCSLKIVAKMLTTRMQQEIPKIIDVDQTGFIRGRSLSENFIYAMELVQCCHHRKLSTLVLKLDFAKAFDSVNWQSLEKIMLIRGFSSTWCRWIDAILHTSKSAVLVNGHPGPWFPCKRGLRQGDPLSPYLFLLVADVLQQMIKQVSGIRHPVSPELPCPVLQYADDTLILLRADHGDLQQLKEVLDSFSAATGLLINFDKSTMVPMHTPAATVTELQAILGCRVEGFPQTYLGLPLSCDKLKLSAFSPLIAKADKYLCGWQTSLLNPRGRMVLVDTVLDSQLVHAMSVMLLPQGVLDAFDRRRRAFLWTGEDKVHGSQCLVAWETACQPKSQGGLGIRQLASHNKCLMLKLLHRLHNSNDSAWASWVRRRISLASMHGDIFGAHWRDLEELVPLYRAVTICEVKNGESTNFWCDLWSQAGRLCDAFPLLYSHATNAEISVAEVMREGLDTYLVPRITRAGRDELIKLQSVLAAIVLTEEEDRRTSPLCDRNNTLRSGPVYKRLMEATGSPACAFADFVWKNRAPPRVQFFAWLLVQERVQCRANLQHKNIVDDATCALCSQAVEDCNHLILHCSFAAQAWSSLNIDITGKTVTALWELDRPATIPLKHFGSYILLVCWQLWKHRNGVVFNNDQPSHARLWAACKEDARLWCYRWPTADRTIADAWCNSFHIM